jgi:hypothetical protein
MGNIKNYNFNKLNLRLSNSDYWDFYLANDEGNGGGCYPLTSGDCFVVWYDFNNLDIFPSSATTSPDIYSLVYWTGATNTGYTFNTYGLTGIDNGVILFDKPSGDTTNQTLLAALTGSTLLIPSGDSRYHMTKVSGTTGDFTYGGDLYYDPLQPNVGTFYNLYGGFFQGYFKLDGSTYEVLPTRVNNSWSAEFWLTTKDYTTPTGTTLNDLYPDNAGFFFYMGTRAENKFWNQWGGADSGCTSGCTADSGCTDTISEWCTIPKEDDLTIIGDYGFPIPLDPPRVDIDLITNNFLIYGRAYDSRPKNLTGATGTILNNSGITATTIGVCSGCGGSHDGLGTYTVCTYDKKGVPIKRNRTVVTNDTNPFLVYGRASKNKSSCGSCGGNHDGFGTETVCSFTGFTSDETMIDYNIDIIDNALGFRITPDGEIGYRLLTVTGQTITGITENTCITGITVTEEYTTLPVITGDSWYYVVVKFETDYKEGCDLKTSKRRKGKLKIYVNGYLKLTINEFDEFLWKRLDEYKDKQVGVPFNMSIGGGSQGLLESQTFGGLDLNDRGLPIETNFGGTFMGGISQFKFNICDLSLCQIRENYEADALKYGLNNKF